MSVKIEMEMPKGCLLCRFFNPVYDTCHAMPVVKKTLVSDEYRHPACPLIEEEQPCPHWFSDAHFCNNIGKEIKCRSWSKE